MVRFTTAEGRVLQARPVFEQLTPKGLKQGDTVDVRYDPADPGWLVIGELDYGNTRLIKWGLGMMVAPVLLAPLAFCIYKGLTAVDLATAPPVELGPRTAPTGDETSATTSWLGVLLFGGFAAALAWDGRRKYSRWLERFGRSHEVTATIVDVNLNVGGTIRNAQPVYRFAGLDGKERTAPLGAPPCGLAPGEAVHGWVVDPRAVRPRRAPVGGRERRHLEERTSAALRRRCRLRCRSSPLRRRCAICCSGDARLGALAQRSG